jgi:hypothetical protein
MMPLRSLILHNGWLKVVSLLFASLIYVAIETGQSDFKFPRTLIPTPELEVRCPISVLNAPGSPAVFAIEPSAVVVKVQGRHPILKRLDPESIQAFVKLTGVTNLRRSFRVEVQVPPEVTLKEVVPDQVTVQPAPAPDK